MSTPVVARKTPRWRVIFEIVSTVTMLVLAAALVWEGRARLRAPQPPPQPIVPVPKDPISIGTAPVRGDRSAGVAIIEFADFECSACASFARDVEPALLRDYVDTGKAVIVFKHFPLPIHRKATGTAAAAWCAGEQGRFWQAHDRLYAQTQPQNLATEVDLDVPRYNACLAGPGSAQGVEADRVEGEALHIRGTPTFFVGKLAPNGLVQVTDTMIGAEALERFRGIVDRLLNRGRFPNQPGGRGGM